MIKIGETKSSYRDFIIHNLEYSEAKQVRFEIDEKKPDILKTEKKEEDIINKNSMIDKKEENFKFILMPLPKKYGEESN